MAFQHPNESDQHPACHHSHRASAEPCGLGVVPSMQRRGQIGSNSWNTKLVNDGDGTIFSFVATRHTTGGAWAPLDQSTGHESDAIKGDATGVRSD
eukprot:SAG31_NODE_1039_length_10212_cov_8.897063_3_plen_96_part_00